MVPYNLWSDYFIVRSIEELINSSESVTNEKNCVKKTQSAHLFLKEAFVMLLYIVWKKAIADHEAGSHNAEK